MKKSNGVPGKEAWGEVPRDDLDMQAAYKDFFGKSNSEMQEAFTNCIIEMADGLRWMPPVPFRYYIKGFIEILLAGKLDKFEAADAASSFLRLIEEKLTEQPKFVAPVMDEILSVVRHLAENQVEFGADSDIFGDFKEKQRAIEELWAAHK